MQATDRRAFLRAAGLGLLAFQVNGAEVLLRPGEARKQGATLRVLTAAEASVIEHLGEALLPGAAAAGIAHFLDHHLAADPADSLLMLRYLDVPPPYLTFYRGAIAALDEYARSHFERPIPELPAAQLDELIGQIARSNPEGWQGPPAPLVYFVFRNDAVDVMYGTPEGFEKLGIPYMAHIMPPSKW